MITIKSLEDINIKFKTNKSFNRIVLSKNNYDNLMDSIIETNEKVFPSYNITWSNILPNHIALLMNRYEIIEVINLNKKIK